MAVCHWKLHFSDKDLGTDRVFFTADHHFQHEAIIGYCDRPFDSVEEMNRVMVDRWNEVVSEGDIVFHLGDFTLNGTQTAMHHISKLNGLIYMIPGGHDKGWIRGLYDQREVWVDDEEKARILDPLVTADFPGNKCIVMCHYAMKIWDRKHHGSRHLFGHSHGNFEGDDLSMDVGVDTNRFYPYSFESIVEKLI